MRGLEDALARIARRDELRERTGDGRGGAHRMERPALTSSDASASLSPVSPVVDEVAESLRAVVRRNPGVFATVVVQEADTAWSVWIGEWDGTLRTRVTRLESDPAADETADESRGAPEPVAVPDTVPLPQAAPVPEPARIPEPIPVPEAAPASGPVPTLAPPARTAAPVPAGVAVSAAPARAHALVPDPAPGPAPYPPVAPPAAANATADRYTGTAPPSGPSEPLNRGDTPTVLPRPVIGPAMNDRVALRIADLLRREASRETRSDA